MAAPQMIHLCVCAKNHVLICCYISVFGILMLSCWPIAWVYTVILTLSVQICAEWFGTY